MVRLWWRLSGQICGWFFQILFFYPGCEWCIIRLPSMKYFGWESCLVLRFESCYFLGSWWSSVFVLALSLAMELSMVSFLVLKFGVHWLRFVACLSFGFSLSLILVRGISPCSLFYGRFYLGVYWSCHLLLSDFAAFRGVMKINRS